MTRAEACLILNMVDHIGPVTVRRLTQRFGSPEAILDANLSDLKSVDGVGAKSAKAISDWRQSIPWEAELEHIQRAGLRLIHQEDPDYPVHLKEIHDPPLVLYTHGRLEAGEKNSLAMVGMRHPSHYGQETARKLGYQFGNIGMTVVSGLALGIDSASHRGCLQAKGHTVAVLGFGFQYLARAENARLAQEIVEAGGAVISEFPFVRPPDRQTFPMRNRIVSGMTLGTLVVEAGINSGALITANFALEQGRQVFAVPGRVDSPQAQGCHKLIQNGAKLVQCVEDVLEEFAYLLPKGRKTETGGETVPTPAIKLTDTEKTVLDAVGDEEAEIDAITAVCELPPSVVSATLLVLEMKHVVRQLPGKRYVRLISRETTP
ncbi:MAG: DNA-protecting protein DprA [Verrucomicrobia bacterium]|nr:DNA-protecting protein DprA [Verrucomicrobiota bacterium]